MRKEPELLVPVSEARGPTRPAARQRWAVILTRIWIVLAVISAIFVLLFSNEHTANFKGAALTIAGFAIAWNVVAWIFGRTLPSADEQR